MAGKHNSPLNAYLSSLSEAAELFRGPLTYFSVPFEAVELETVRFRRSRPLQGRANQRLLWADDKQVQSIRQACRHRRVRVLHFPGADLLGGSGFMIPATKEKSLWKRSVKRSRCGITIRRWRKSGRSGNRWQNWRGFWAIPSESGRAKNADAWKPFYSVTRLPHRPTAIIFDAGVNLAHQTPRFGQRRDDPLIFFLLRVTERSAIRSLSQRWAGR